MATQNSINSVFTDNSDGFLIGGGTTERDLTVTGANITLTGAGTNVYTFPSATSTLAALTLAQTFTATQTFAPAARTTGSPNILVVTTPADTTLTASTESTSVLLNLSASRQFATGALTTQRETLIQAPTYAFVGASTITTAATVQITGAPVGGTNATLTTAIALSIPTSVLANTTTGYGLNVAAPSGATNNYAAIFTGAVGINGTPSSSITLNVGSASATTAAQGLMFGGDTTANLYRGAAGLTTDTTQFNLPSASNIVLKDGAIFKDGGSTGNQFIIGGGTSTYQLNGSATATATSSTSATSIAASITGAVTVTTGKWTGVNLAPGLGNSSSTNIYNSSTQLAAGVAVQPTLNISTSSTTGYASLYINPTETSVSATATNYLLWAGVAGTVKTSLTTAGVLTTPSILNLNNAIAAVSNTATVPVTQRLSTVTNNSAATLTITITTTGATDGQLVLVRVYDFSAVAQTLTWVNTENSTATVPTTSNGSTTLPVTVGFQFNSATTKWRCLFSV